MSELETQYQCFFVARLPFCEGNESQRRMVQSTEGIGAFIEGFWLNDALKYTKGSDCLYWIPPSAIMFIAKVAP